MNTLFAPSCSLMLYKPELAEKVYKFLNTGTEKIEMITTCCKNTCNLGHGTQVINVCPDCDNIYSTMYEGVTTISFWEYIAFSDEFNFPDYGGIKMSIHDSCPTRKNQRVHMAIRILAEKMNIQVVESEYSMLNSVCCGDSYYYVSSLEETKEQMRKRAAQMPTDDVIVHCINCMKAMYVGGKNPRYLLDLLFEEKTIIGTYEPEVWHEILDTYSKSH